ncbi:MAG: hypothetical protein ABIK08_11445 [Pseudomonadota bacterium]
MLKPRLLPEWKRILRRAWSIRLAALAGVLSACEAILPLYVDAMPRSLFAWLSLVTITGALIARVVAQKGMS